MLTLVLLGTPTSWAITGTTQALVNDLDRYADSEDAAPLSKHLHPKVGACVDDVENNMIARFVLTRVRKQGLPDALEMREVSESEIDSLSKQAKKMGMSMPVAPTQELRLNYTDHTARVFLAPHDDDMKWVLPCR